jgi:hypothetical protein
MSREILIKCDFCKQEIPKEKHRDIFGNDYEIYKRGKLKNIYSKISIDLEKLGIDCCVKCAKNIDKNALEFKIDAFYQTSF